MSSGPRDHEELIPYDLEAEPRYLMPTFVTDAKEGDVIELNRDGKPYRKVRVTRVLHGPGGQVMLDTEPA